MRKSISLLVALAMVLSLFGGFGNLRTASAAPVVGASSLQVRIVSSPSTANVGDTFYVNATVANPTAAAITTSANLGISAGATVLDTNPKTLVVPADGVIDVWWQVECTAAGTTILTVTASGSSDQATVTQIATPVNPKIIVTIIEPLTDVTVPVSTNSVIKATVHNDSGQDLTGASVTLVIPAGQPGVLTNGDVPTIPLTNAGSLFFYAGTTETVAWNVHCTSPGTVVYTVTAVADGVTAAQVQTDVVTFYQGTQPGPETPGNLSIELYSPEKVCTDCGQPNYMVKARVCNNGTTPITNVYATLHLNDGSLANIQPPITLPIGDQVVYGAAPAAGTPLFPASTANPIKFLDLNGNGTWDAGEVLYYDGMPAPLLGDNLVSIGDTRISAEPKYIAAVAPNFDTLAVTAIAKAHDIANNATIVISTDATGLITSIVTNPVMTVKAFTAGHILFDFTSDTIASLTELEVGDALAFADLTVTAGNDLAVNTDVIYLNKAATGYLVNSVVAVGDTDLGIALTLDSLLKSTTAVWAVTLPVATPIIRDLVNLLANTYELPMLAPGECRVVTWMVHPNLPGSVVFTATATGQGGTPVVTLTDTATSTTLQKNVRTDIISNLPVGNPPVPNPTGLFEPVLLGDTIPSGLAVGDLNFGRDVNLVFPGDPLKTDGSLTLPGEKYFDANGNGVFDATEPIVFDSTAPFSVYNPVDQYLYQEVGSKFDITAFVDNCTCLAWANVLTAISANGLPIPLIAGSTDNVKWDPANMVVDIQKFQRADVISGLWEAFGDPYSIPVDQLNPNGNVLDNSMCACCGIKITWHLECNAPSTDVIQVKSSSLANPAVVYDTSSLTVIQGGAPCITTNVQFFKGWRSDSTLETDGTCAVLVGDHVTMVIPVANLGGRAAENVAFMASLTGNYTYSSSQIVGATGTVTPVTGGYSVSIPSLGAYTSAKVIIELTCFGPADLHVTLLNVDDHSTITYLDSLNHLAPSVLCQYPSSGTLVQVPLTVNWINPGAEIDQDLTTPGVQIAVSTKFAVKISLTNGDPVTDLNNVTVTLHWGSTGDARVGNGASLFDGSSDNHQGAEIWGTNQSVIRTLDGPLVHGTTEEVSWEMHCTSPGDVYFWVTVEAQAGTGDCYKVATTSDYSNIYNESGYFEQLPAATLAGTIVSPAEYSVYATGSRFAVTATFTNSTAFTATNVVVSVFFGNTTGDPAAVVTSTSPNPEDVSLGDMLAGASRSITWEMQATRPTPSGSEEELVVYYKGDNSYLDYTAVDTNHPYYIYPAAHLVVSFNAIADQTIGSDFNLTGTVRNIGWADATDVVLNLAVGHGDVAPAPGSGYTLPLGLIPAERGGVANPIPFTWHLQAEAVGKAYIVITATGRDEYGYSHRIDQLYGSDYGLFQLPSVMYNSFADFLARGIVPLAPIPTWATEVPDTLAFNVMPIVPPVDTTAPLVAIYSPNGTTQASTTFTMGYSSSASDLAKYELNLNGGVWMDNELNTTFTFTGLVPGVNTLYVRATDLSGNVGLPVSITVTVDMTVPTVTIVPIAALTSQNYGTLTYSAAGGTAPYTFRIKINNGGWIDWGTATSYMYTGLAEGMNVLAVEAKDALGKTGVAFVYVTLDTIAPVAPFANPIGGFYTAPQTVVLNDAEVGVTIYYTLNGTLPTMSSTVYAAPINIGAGTTVLKAIAADASGNVSGVMTEIYVVNPVSVVSATLNMTDGYILISVPFNASINVLGTNVTEVYEWTGVLWSPVTTLNPGIGYLVYHTGVETITVSGTATTSPFTTPSIGSYQLIGDPFEVACAWPTGSAIAEAYAWNGTLWVSATGSMQPGIGYLVRTTSVGTLTFVRP